MSQLWEALSRCIKGSAFDSLCDELHRQADLAFTHTMLKHKSWNGAIYVRRGANRIWVDPGNAVYTVSYILLRSMCDWIISRGRTQVPPFMESDMDRARRFKDCLVAL